MTEADDERARILAKAYELFLAHGYSRVTMDELSAELRMSKKTLYRFFPSKEALCEAVITSSFAKIGEELHAVIDDEKTDFSERLRAFVRTVAGHYARGSTVLRDLQRDAPALWRKLSDRRRESVQARFGALYAAGVRAGAFRADVEPRVVIRVVMTLVDQLMRPDVTAELELSAEELFPRLLGIVLDGVRTRAEPSLRSRRKQRRGG